MPMVGQVTRGAISSHARNSGFRHLSLLAAATLAALGTTIVDARAAHGTSVPCDTASLVSAIDTANNTYGGGTLSLAPGCTYTLTIANNNDLHHGYNAFPVITGKVIIHGNGATIERSTSLQCSSTARANCFRFFFVKRPGRMWIDSLTFRNGAAEPGIPHPRGGGAILNRGKLSLTGVTFTDNTVTDPNTAGGGAIENHDSGRLTILQSTFSGNSATQAGAIEDDSTLSTSYMVISQSTFSGNQSTMFDGGAVENVAGAHDTLTADTFVGNQGKGGGAIYAPGTMTIDDSTFTNNVAGTDGGGAIQNAGQLTITRSTLSGNRSPYGANIHTYHLGGAARPVTTLAMTIVANGGGGGDNCSGTDPITDAGYNLDTGTSCISSKNQSFTSMQPQLEALASNGGPAQTMALPSSSPAVNAVPTDATGCNGTDQRGVSRPQGPGCDIGAYEMIITTGDSQAPTAPTMVSASAVTASSVTLRWDASSDNVGVTGYTVYRSGAAVGATGGADATTFVDSSVTPSMAYTYSVDAFDGSGNHSPPSSPPLSVTTPSS
jgi:predicted outer membrane repeat protein